MRISLIAALIILVAPGAVVGQIIKAKHSYVVYKTGDTVLVRVINERKKDLEFAEVQNAKLTRTIHKDELLGYQNYELWNLPLPQNENGRFEFQEVIPVPDVSKNDLFTRAKSWYAKTYKDARAVLELDDREGGILQGTGYFECVTSLYTIKVWHSLRIEVKEGRYRYTLNEFERETESYVIGTKHIPSTKTPMEAWYDARPITASNLGKNADKEFRSEVILKVNRLIKSISDAMSATEGDSDW